MMGQERLVGPKMARKRPAVTCRRDRFQPDRLRSIPAAVPEGTQVEGITGHGTAPGRFRVVQRLPIRIQAARVVTSDLQESETIRLSGRPSQILQPPGEPLGAESPVLGR